LLGGDIPRSAKVTDNFEPQNRQWPVGIFWVFGFCGFVRDRQGTLGGRLMRSVVCRTFSEFLRGGFLSVTVLVPLRTRFLAYVRALPMRCALAPPLTFVAPVAKEGESRRLVRPSFPRTAMPARSSQCPSGGRTSGAALRRLRSRLGAKPLSISRRRREFHWFLRDGCLERQRGSQRVPHRRCVCIYEKATGRRHENGHR
jgi:hypothetical protein